MFTLLSSFISSGSLVSHYSFSTSLHVTKLSPFSSVIRVMVTMTLCPFSALLLQRVSLLPSHLPLFYSLCLSVPPFFLIWILLCLSLTSPLLLFPAPLCPKSTLSVVVLCFDICVYLAAVCSAGSLTDRAGLNKEGKLGKGNTCTPTNPGTHGFTAAAVRLLWHAADKHTQNHACLNLCCDSCSVQQPVPFYFTFVI